MAGKFILLDEAAKLLGVTDDELIEMRSRGDIHGYRDGAQWKFKAEDVDRLAQERSAQPPSDPGAGESDVLLSELELGPSASAGSKTATRRWSRASACRWIARPMRPWPTSA